MNEEQQKLYDVLVRDGYYTKSFEEFQAQFQDSAYQDKVFGVVERDGLFTKGKDSFLEKYAVAEKKKDDTEFVSEVGSLEPVAVEEDDLLARHDSLEQTYMDAWKRMQDIQALENPNNQQIQELQELNTTFTTALNEYNQVADQIRSEAPKGQDPAERVRNLRQGVSRKNEDGGRSTVKMADMEVDGKFVAVPTLFPKDPNNYGPNPEDWVEFGEEDAMGAYDMALERGEVFEFDTPEEAREFAKGSWKEMEEEPPKDEFNKSLEFVNNRLIDRSDAGQVARELEYEFGDFGFNFDRGFEVGIGNYVKVTASNGETIDVNTNPQFLTDEDTQADLLRDFLIKNRGTTPKREVEQSIEVGRKELDRLKGVYEQTHGDYERAAAKVEEYRQKVQADESAYDEAEAKRLVDAVNAAAQADQKAVDEYNAVLNVQSAEIDELNRIAQEKRDEPDAFERTFGKNAVTDFIADNTYRPIIQGQAQSGTIRSSYDLMVNANDVTDEDIAEFLRAQAVLEEYGPSDEMRDFQRIYQEEGGGWGGFVSAVMKRPPPLGELFVSSVSMMANKEVAKGAFTVGISSAPLGLMGGPASAITVPAAFLTGAMGGAGATLEAGISFAEFLRDEMAEKQGVDPENVVMDNEKIREVLSDPEAMSRIRYRAGGRGIAIGLTSLIGTGVAATVTRRTAIKTGSKFKAGIAGAAIEMPFEGLGETAGQLVAGQEMDVADILLETAAGGPAQAVGVGIGLFKAPQYTLNGELVTGKQMADFIREADEADVAGATIEIKNNDTLAKQAHDKRDNARERVVIKEQLRKSGIENEETVDKLADLELEKRKLKGLETTAAERKRTRIQNEIDAILDGDSYFFEETTDEQGNKRSKEVRVTRRDALLALAEDDVLNPTEKEIEAKQAELFRDALADIQESDAVQEPSTEEVDVGEQPADGEEVGVGDTEEQAVAEEEAVVDEEAEELDAAFEAESTPDVEEDIDGVTVRRREGYEFGRKAQRVLDQAKKRVKALENFGVKIVLHENDAQYGAATGKGGRGVYLTEVDAEGNVISKTIHINLDKANSRTVAHEAFHALFLERVKGDDAKAQQWAKATMKSVRKALDADSVLATRIDDFLARYEENVIDEEALAEIFGYLSEGYGELTGPQQSRVKAAIKKLIELFGLKLESQWSQDDQNVIDVLNTLSGKMERGETITEEELSGLDVSEEKAKEVAEETTVDNRIAGLQEKRQGAERSAVQDTDLSKLDGAIGRTGDSAAQRVYNKLFNSVRTGKLRSLEKQMREANKSKKMSAEDKEARIDKLEQQYNNELERLAKAREDVKARVEQELKRLEPEIEKAAVKERLAEIREEQRAITKKLDKDKREAKKAYEGEEQKEYVKALTEEAEAKRAALRDEIAELRGEKKKVEPTVEAETAPVDDVAKTKETLAEEKEKIKGLKKKLAEAKRDLREFEAREEKKRGRKEEGVKKKAVADIESAIQDTDKNIKELEAEIAKREAAPVEEGEVTVATIRTKVGVEAFGKLEAAVRSYFDYLVTVNTFEEERTRGEKATLSRRLNKVSKMADELGLTDAEQAVMQNSVREARRGEQRAEASRKAEQAELKAAAERAKQAAEEKEVTPEATVDNAEIARLEEELRQAQEDLDFYNRDEPDNTKYPKYKSFKQAKEAINAGKDPRFHSMEDAPSMGAQTANENLDKKYTAEQQTPYITGLETTMVFEDSARAALESINRTYRATKSRDTTGVGQQLEDNVEEIKKQLAEAKAKKAPVDDVAKRAAVEGISVEEMTKREAQEAAEAKLNVARSEQRKLDALKGKTDKKSVAERKNIKQFIEDLKTMSVEEARAKRAPSAREQRVADVVERYEFRPNGSLKESSLAGELRRNLKRYGFGVEQFGTRMDDFHIVNPETGRKVDPKKLIAKDRADEKVEMEQRAELRERDAKERMEREDVEEAKAQELQEMQDQYVDFPEEMLSAPSRLSPREQRESLQDNAGKFNDTALVKFAKERGYSDAAILKVRPTAQAAIDAYDAKATRLSREVQGIIQRARERARGDKKIQAIENKGQRTRAVNDRIIKDVKAYIQKSKMYEEASDVGREAMMRAVDKQMGRRIKAAPSVIKLLGLTPDGDVLIDKKGLLEQIRVMARSSKATAAASREIMREVGKDIARLKATGAISGKQATAILRKMANMDPFNPVQVENFVNYTARVFAEAEYIEEVNKLNKLRKRALKNASKKLGISPDLMPMLQTLLNMDARLVPESVFEKYKELVNDLGERKTVLNLKERTQMFDDVVSIMSGINEELAKKEELFARYEAYTSKADSVKGKIADMVKDEVITTEESDILKKYADELREERKMSKEEKEKAREEERAKLVDAIQRLPKLDRKFPTQMENKLVRRFNKLVRTAGLLELTNADLKNVLRVADNIQNGFLPHTAQVLVEQVEANNRTVEVSQAIKEAKLPRIARVRALLDGVTRGSTVEKLVNRNPLRFIDQVYGNYTGTTIYDAAFKDLASGYASYKSDIMGVEERLDRVEQKLMKSLRRNPNAVVRSKFLIGAYMMQAEFDTNPDVSGVFDAVSLLDSTIKNSKQKKGEAFYNDATIKVLEDLRKKIDGKSAEEIRDMLSAEERAVADEVRDINDELTPKAEYVAGVLRGVPFRPFSQYFHRVVLNEKDKAGLRGIDALIDEAKTRMRKPSTKAQNVQERITTSPPPVNFDPFASARRGARYILTDYHMTEAVRTNARLMNNLRGTEMTSKQRKFFDAIDSASESAVTDALVQSYTFSTWMEKAFEWAKRQSYRMVLFDVARTGGETLSNLLFITVAAGRQFTEGVSKHFRTMSNDGGDIMRNVGSVQTTRLYADTKTISSRMVESLRSTTGPEKGDVNHPVFNRLKQIWAYSGAPWQGAVGKLADIGITAPDKAIMRPVWFGTFALEFKNRTGQEVDFDKIAANDEAYMAANEEAIQAATDAADLASVQAGATDNPFLGIVSSMRKAGGESSPGMALYRAVNNYMTRFLVFEYVTMRTATKAAVGNGTISPMKGARLMGAVTLRMVAYVMVTNALRDAIQRALGLEDEGDDETFEEKFADAVRQSFVSLGVGGTRGSLYRAVINTAIEYERASMMGENGLDYTFEDGVFIPLMSPAQDGRPFKKMSDAVARASGPYNPMVRTATLLGRLVLDSDKKTAESIKRRADEFDRLGLEVLGMMGLIPFYKDLRNIMIKDIYKDLDKEDSPENIEKRIQEELLKARKEAKKKR